MNNSSDNDSSILETGHCKSKHDSLNAIRSRSGQIYAAAFLVFLLGFAVAFLVQETDFGHSQAGQLSGFIAYFCSPLPIIPLLLVSWGGSLQFMHWLRQHRN